MPGILSGRADDGLLRRLSVGRRGTVQGRDRRFVCVGTCEGAEGKRTDRAAKGADGRREVHSLVETADMIDRIDTPSITGSHALEVLVQDRLDRRNILHVQYEIYHPVTKDKLNVDSCKDVNLIRYHYMTV